MLLGEAPGGRVVVGDWESVGDAVSVALGVGAPVPVPDTVCVAVALAVGVCVPVGEQLGKLLPVAEAVAPGDNGGDAELDSVGEGLDVGEAVKAPVPLPVGEGLLVAVGLGDCVLLLLLLCETLPVLLGDAPIVSDGVGDTESVELPLKVLLVVGTAVRELVAVPLCVTVALGVIGPLPLLLSELEPVLEEEAPIVRLAVGETVLVLLPLTVVLADTDPVLLPDCVAVPVGEEEGDKELVGDAVRETVPVLEGLAPVVIEPVTL